MSAHRIYCYAPQRIAAEDFLASVGAIISRDAPCPVSDEYYLRGLDHITFIVIDGHPNPVPQPMWETIMRQGAIVIHVDDQYKRTRAAARVPIKHYPGEKREASAPTAD